MSITLKVGIIGGTGLDNPDIFRNKTEKKVTTIFGEPSSSLLIGEIENVPCVLIARHGRKHSIMPGNVNYRANIWALKEEGCTHIISSTATGSLLEEIKPGDLVIVDSFIDKTQGRPQSFFDGQPDHPEGLCHMPMEPAMCERLRKLIISTAKNMNIGVHESGTVISIEGPRFSSKAESHMHRQWGAHVVNMTSVPEIGLAKEAGICYATIALATDYDCWRTTGEKVTHTQVLQCFKENVGKVTKLITSAIANIGKENWDETIKETRDLVTSSIFATH